MKSRSLWLEILTTGKHATKAGSARTVTISDLDAMVARYAPSYHEAPVAIGPVTDSSPAYGWVEALKREGSLLLAKIKSAVPEFLEMVRNGSLTREKVSFYPDLTLRCLVFAGAPPPVVQALANINLADGKGHHMTFEFGDITRSAGDRLHEKIMDTLKNPPKFDSVGRPINTALDYGQATQRILEANPDLAMAYADETLPGRETINP
jgi:hypothetical protein